jgi:DNA-binding transcriptional ArsR family regulator
MAKYDGDMTTRQPASPAKEVKLSRTLSALSDPTRRAIVGRLSKGSATAGELADPFSIGLPTISKHLRTLESAGLVMRERRAQWHVFRLQAQPLAEVNDWLQTYQAFWQGSLDSLHDYVEQLNAGKGAPATKASRADEPAKPPARRRTRK